MKIEVNGAVYRISEGNRKLKPNSKTAFLVWNLPAVKTCPYRTAMCEKACYAKKAERAYPQVLPAREANLEATKSATFVDDMTDIIIAYARKSKKEQIVQRIHESGDFYCKAYAMDWLEIARRVHADPAGKRVVFMAYTKSVRFFDGVEIPEYFSLRASLWADTKPEEIEIILRNGFPIYTAVESFTEADTFHQCRCSDCATCGKCWSGEPDIRCEIH